jgi:hypothetical protein
MNIQPSELATIILSVCGGLGIIIIALGFACGLAVGIARMGRAAPREFANALPRIIDRLRGR